MKHIPAGHLTVLKQYPWLVIEQGKKHVKVRHPETQDFVPIAGSPSDHRSLKNFAADIRRLATTGQGSIHHMKKGATAQ